MKFQTCFVVPMFRIKFSFVMSNSTFVLNMKVCVCVSGYTGFKKNVPFFKVLVFP